jgi:hypothetical protein
MTTEVQGAKYIMGGNTKSKLLVHCVKLRHR